MLNKRDIMYRIIDLEMIQDDHDDRLAELEKKFDELFKKKVTKKKAKK